MCLFPSFPSSRRGRVLLPHQHAIDAKLVFQQEMAYIFSVLLLVVGQIGRAAVGAARGIELGRRRQRRVVDAPLLPGHEVVQEPVEVVREVRVVLDLVVRAQAAERGAVQVLASRTVPAQGLAFFSVHELDGDRLRERRAGVQAHQGRTARSSRRRPRQLADRTIGARTRLDIRQRRRRKAPRLLINTFRRRRDLGRRACGRRRAARVAIIATRRG